MYCSMSGKAEGVEVIEGMAVVKEIKYLSLKVQGKKNLFEGQRKVMVGKAKWLSTLMSGVVERSCHRVMVGKSFWKGVAIPRILYGAEVVGMRVQDIEVIQRQENAAMRRMLGANRGVAIAGMRGEVGISDMKSRIGRCKMQYRRRVEQGTNEMLKRVMRGTVLGRSEWAADLRRYMNWVGMNEEQIVGETEVGVKMKVAEMVHKEWRDEMETKSSLRIYRRYKTKMREEDYGCLLYTSPSPRDKRQSRMPSSA